MDCAAVTTLADATRAIAKSITTRVLYSETKDTHPGNHRVAYWGLETQNGQPRT